MVARTARSVIFKYIFKSFYPASFGCRSRSSCESQLAVHTIRFFFLFIFSFFFLSLTLFPFAALFRVFDHVFRCKKPPSTTRHGKDGRTRGREQKEERSRCAITCIEYPHALRTMFLVALLVPCVYVLGIAERKNIFVVPRTNEPSNVCRNLHPAKRPYTC